MNALLLRKFTLAAILTGMTSGYGWSATYKQPNTSIELFQLEKVPLQVHSMKDISKQLVILAQRSQDESPAHCRASAQMLALAIQLDPTNQDARQANQAFSESNPAPATSKEQVIKAKSKIRFYKNWLSNQDAGAQANLLASYLTDATKILQPETAHQADSANWKNVIPALDAYDGHTEESPKETGANPAVTPTTPDQPDRTEPQDSDPPQDNTSQKVTFHIANVSSKVPLTTETSQKYLDPKDNSEKHRTVKKEAITSVTAEIRSNKDKESSMELHFSPRIHEKHSDPKKPSLDSQIKSTLSALFKARYHGIPSSKVTIKISDGSYATSNGTILTTPVALMLDASLGNRPLRQDIHILADINGVGELSQPSNFWRQLKILRANETGGRLIVAAESARLLLQLLVYGEPDFFTRWEVFSATDLNQAMEAAAKSSPEKLAEASELFESIQNLTKKSDVTKLAVNRAVRKRLSDIIELCPNHLSSSVLLVQGGGKRPMRLSEEALTHELLPILYSIRKQLGSLDANRLPKSSSLKDTHSSFRAKLDPMERIIDRSHDELYEDTIKLANDVRRLMTISRRISSNSSSSHSHIKSAEAVIFEMRGTCARLIERAEQITQTGK